MAGNPSTIPTDPYLTYHDKELLQKVEDDLTKQFCYTWLEDWFENELDVAVQKLVTNNERARLELAQLLAFEACVYLTEKGLLPKEQL